VKHPTAGWSIASAALSLLLLLGGCARSTARGPQRPTTPPIPHGQLGCLGPAAVTPLTATPTVSEARAITIAQGAYAHPGTPHSPRLGALLSVEHGMIHRPEGTPTGPTSTGASGAIENRDIWLLVFQAIPPAGQPTIPPTVASQYRVYVVIDAVTGLVIDSCN